MKTVNNIVVVPETDAEWEEALVWILYSPDLDEIAQLLRTPEWKEWSTSPLRVTDPRDDPRPGVGLSKICLIGKSRFKEIGWWHDLMYRAATSLDHPKSAVDWRFRELCLLPEFSRNETGVAIALFYYKVVRKWPSKYEGPP